MNSIGLRKALGAAIVAAIGVGVTLLKGDVPANLMALLIAVYGAFVTGNLGEHAASVFKAKAEAQQPSTVEVDTSEIEAKLDALQETSTNAANGVSALIAWVQQSTRKTP